MVNRQMLVLFWIVFIIASATLFRVFRATHSDLSTISTLDWWDDNLRKQVLTRLDSIMYGVLGAYLYCYKATLWNNNKITMLYVGLGFLAYDNLQWCLVNSIWYRDYVTLTVQSVGTLLLLPKLCSIDSGKGWLYKFLTFVSIISYSMYLLHLSVIQGILLPGILKAVPVAHKASLTLCLVKYFLYFILTIGLSHLMYRLYERPMMNLRELVRPSIGRPGRRLPSGPSETSKSEVCPAPQPLESVGPSSSPGG
jgi:peptidoglycan/LPS O-acetylase OafA/YrhL